MDFQTSRITYKCLQNSNSDSRLRWEAVGLSHWQWEDVSLPRYPKIVENLLQESMRHPEISEKLSRRLTVQGNWVRYSKHTRKSLQRHGYWSANSTSTEKPLQHPKHTEKSLCPWVWGSHHSILWAQGKPPHIPQTRRDSRNTPLKRVWLGLVMGICPSGYSSLFSQII